MSSVPPGGLILVSGANGYIASVALQVFLQRGYRVRGTVRDIVPNAWMKGYFGSRFELVEVPNIRSPGAFAEAIKGVDGIAHVAMNMDMDPHHHAVIEDSVNANLHLLAAAAREPSVEVPRKMGKPQGFTSLEDTLVKAVDVILENQSKNVPKTRIDLYYEALASPSSGQ